MAAREYLVDAGPLVALIDASDRDHPWSRKTLGRLPCPLITCEAVLSEVLFLLRKDPVAPQKIGALLERGLLICRPIMNMEHVQVLGLMQTYRDVPMSLADASLVRLTEIIADSTIVTLDSDFLIYRRHRNKTIPVLAPPRIR
jgi:predicted nucleic acid-binding protein